MINTGLPTLPLLAFFSPHLPSSRQTFQTPAFLEILTIFRFYDMQVEMQDLLVRITQNMCTAQLRLSRLLGTTQMSPDNLQFDFRKRGCTVLVSF